MIKLIKLLFLIPVLMHPAEAQTTFDLYPKEIPNSKTSSDNENEEISNGIKIISKISKPTISIFLPSNRKTSGAAVIIFPGGGYWVNAIGHEGYDIARKFNEWGLTAFVVKYRIPNDATMENKEIGPLQDAQQAIKIVRQRAAEWDLKTDHIGIMGFSAGGHLASTAGTHFQKSYILNDEKINLRPDFMILVYPVISFQDGITHEGSRNQLIGKHPTKEKIDLYSNELQVTKATPPTFLIHASDDDAVKSENSVLFYQSLLKNKVPAELHIYEKGGHGFGMNNKTTQDAWIDRCKNWMQSNGWL